MRHSRLIFLLVLTLATLTAGAARVVIKGKVVDADHRPLEFVTVRIAGTAIGTTTRTDGSFRLRCESKDTLTVIFSCIGYSESRRQLLNAEGTVTVNQTMQRSEQQLSEVEITQLRKQTGPMRVIEGRKSYRLAADPNASIESMLATTGGVSGAGELSSQYSVRGGSYDENAVYINGMEIYRPLLVTSGQQEGLSAINPDLIDAIGFSTGGFSAEFADKMSSALDIRYRTPVRTGGSLSVSTMGAAATFEQCAGGFSQLHGIRFKRNASLLSTNDTKGEYDPKFLDYQTNLVWKISPALRMSFLGNIAINHYRFTPTDRNTSFGTATDAKQFKVYFDGNEKDRFETWSGSWSLDYMPVKNTMLSLTAGGFLTDELETYDIQGEYWLDEAGTGDAAIGGELGVGRYMEHARNRLKGTVCNISLRGATAISRSNTITYGINATHQKIMERSREWELRDSAGYSLPHDGLNLHMIYALTSNHDMSSNRFSAFIQDQQKIDAASGFWHLTAGLRFTRLTFNEESLISPRVSLGFIPAANPDWALRVAAGVYYQAPFYKEYRIIETDIEGNSRVELNRNIKSQRSVHFIVGSDYTFRIFGRPFKFSTEAYYKALSDLVPYEIENLRIVYSGRNEASGYAAGADFKLFGQFVPGSDSWISFGLMKTQENLRGCKVPLPTDRRYNIGLYLTDYFPGIKRLKFSLRGVLTDGLPVVPPRSSRDKGFFRTPAYKRADIGLNYSIIDERSRLTAVKGLSIGADIFNLFDISNVSSYYWVTDVNGLQYAVPNYLTRRQININMRIEL